jgi:uncharacterized membrane protein YhaH (DUF805 family)
MGESQATTNNRVLEQITAPVFTAAFITVFATVFTTALRVRRQHGRRQRHAREALQVCQLCIRLDKRKKKLLFWGGAEVTYEDTYIAVYATIYNAREALHRIPQSLLLYITYIAGGGPSSDI